MSVAAGAAGQRSGAGTHYAQPDGGGDGEAAQIRKGTEGRYCTAGHLTPHGQNDIVFIKEAGVGDRHAEWRYSFLYDYDHSGSGEPECSKNAFQAGGTVYGRRADPIDQKETAEQERICCIVRNSLLPVVAIRQDLQIRRYMDNHRCGWLSICSILTLLSLRLLSSCLFLKGVLYYIKRIIRYLKRRTVLFEAGRSKRNRFSKVLLVIVNGFLGIGWGICAAVAGGIERGLYVRLSIAA